MNGIEALQALKDGKTVIAYRHSGQKSHNDVYYCFSPKYTYDTEEYSKYIWSRFRDEIFWHRCENPVEFWIVSDNFEIVESD